MSITDELRKYAQDWRENPNLMDDLDAGDIDGLLGDFEHIADRIDAEHEKALDEWKAKHGQMWLKGYAERHAELLEGNETLASDLEGCGWIRLPKDADGVPVCIGDVMEWPDTTTAEVVGVGNGTFFYVEVGENVVEWARTCDKIHHVQESVEDTLREFVNEFNRDDTELCDEEIIEYFAAKLRLADDAE